VEGGEVGSRIRFPVSPERLWDSRNTISLIMELNLRPISSRP
jgi:hypothetical protein